MINAKQEFLNTGTDKVVECAFIYSGTYTPTKFYRLPSDYTPQQYNNFLQALDFEYCNGHSSTQQLYGTIWFTDGTWAERIEYEGKEWWEVKECPVVPEELYNKD